VLVAGLAALAAVVLITALSLAGVLS